jgi:hypothetical protein
MKLLYTLLGLKLLLASAVQADSITTIQLRNRPAVEVIPIVKPMLGADDAITGQGFKLFLRSSPDTLAQVKDMIEILDTAAKILQISVFQGSDRDLRALGISGNIQLESSDASVGIGTNSNKGTGGINYSAHNASGSISTSSVRGQLEDNPLHQLRVTEGTEGYIETGEQIPYFFGVNRIVPEATVGGIEYKDVTTGFYVLPRTHGDNVTLQVSPFKSSQSKARAGNIETLHANTTVTGRIGEWLPIGGATEQIKRSQSGTGSYSSTQSRNNESIWIKADLVQ